MDIYFSVGSLLTLVMGVGNVNIGGSLGGVGM